MCCPKPVDPVKVSSLEITPSHSKADVYRVKGLINPTSLLSIGILEKLAELCDEVYHLVAPGILPYLNAPIRDMFFEIHHGLHHIEHILHACCLIEDVKRLVYCIKKNDFYDYLDKEKRQIDYLRLAARICHGVAHFFATAHFLSEMHLVYIWEFQRLVQCASLIAALAHGLLTISAVHYDKKKLKIKASSSLSEFRIHLSGCVFEALPWIKMIPYLGSCNKIINSITSLAGIVHAWSVLNQEQTIVGKGTIHSHAH